MIDIPRLILKEQPGRNGAQKSQLEATQHGSDRDALVISTGTNLDLTAPRDTETKSVWLNSQQVSDLVVFMTKWLNSQERRKVTRRQDYGYRIPEVLERRRRDGGRRQGVSLARGASIARKATK